MHEVARFEENEPDRHNPDIAVRPIVAQYDPAGQFKQRRALNDGLYVPAIQLKQVGFSCEVLYFPGAHSSMVGCADGAVGSRLG